MQLNSMRSSPEYLLPKDQDAMQLEMRLAATHEAGHAVMQWLVGWSTIEIRLHVDGKDVTKAQAQCPTPSLDGLPSIRKRLLVLFAGNAATRKDWPTSENDRGDWMDALGALHSHLKRKVKWNVADGNIDDAEAASLYRTCRSKCAEILENPKVRAAIDQVAEALVQITPDDNGLIILDGERADLICIDAIGNQFRSENQWVSWMDGGD